MVFRHVGRRIQDEPDQRLGGFPASGIGSVHRNLRADRHFDFGVLVEVDRFLGLEDAVFVDCLPIWA